MIFTWPETAPKLIVLPVRVPVKILLARQGVPLTVGRLRWLSRPASVRYSYC